MKCVLLLAAVYSLIIHQWYKEKGTSLATVQSLQEAAGKVIASGNTATVNYNQGPHFLVLNSVLKLNK